MLWCDARPVRNGRSTGKPTSSRTLTLKFFGSLNTVRMVSACACMSTSWISPSSSGASPFAGGVLTSFSARAEVRAALEACNAAAGRVDAEAMTLSGGSKREMKRGIQRPPLQSMPRECESQSGSGVHERITGVW